MLNFLFFPATAADYNADYTINPSNANRTIIDNTTNELVMRANVATVTVTFDIAVDTIPDDAENFFLFLEGTRRVFVLTPVVTVTIFDLPPAREFSADYT